MKLRNAFAHWNVEVYRIKHHIASGRGLGYVLNAVRASISSSEFNFICRLNSSGENFRINADLLALIIKMDMMIFDIDVPMPTLIRKPTFAEDVLKVCHRFLRDYRMLGEQTPEPLKILVSFPFPFDSRTAYGTRRKHNYIILLPFNRNMKAKAKQIRDAIRAEKSAIRVNWIFHYLRRHSTGWPGFETDLRYKF